MKVYANTTSHKLFMPVGYVNWYEAVYESYVNNHYCSVSEETLDAIKKKAYNSRFRFANRVFKTHKYSIPETVMFMKLSHFIKEIADEIIIISNLGIQDVFKKYPETLSPKTKNKKSSSDCIQLEFDF